MEKNAWEREGLIVLEMCIVLVHIIQTSGNIPESWDLQYLRDSNPEFSFEQIILPVLNCAIYWKALQNGELRSSCQGNLYL